MKTKIYRKKIYKKFSFVQVFICKKCSSALNHQRSSENPQNIAVNRTGHRDHREQHTGKTDIMLHYIKQSFYQHSVIVRNSTQKIHEKDDEE